MPCNQVNSYTLERFIQITKKISQEITNTKVKPVFINYTATSQEKSTENNKSLTTANIQKYHSNPQTEVHFLFYLQRQ